MPRRLAKRLTASGARLTSHDSKLAHVISATGVPHNGSAAYGAMVSYVNAQIEQIAIGDVALRRGRDSIHDTRVAIRRLRSTLRVFGDAVGGIDAELRWWATLLGDARDCHVQQRRFDAALDELAGDLVAAPVRAEVASEFAAVETCACEKISAALMSSRYFGLLAVLRAWRSDPPVPQDLSTRDLHRHAQGARREAHRRLSAAVESEVDDDLALHRARKAVKRARGASELTAPLTAKREAKRNSRRYRKIQDILGDHQDAAVAKAMLRRLAVDEGSSTGRKGFTYGLLFAREERIARCARHDAARLL